ncbi:hypothetical protein D3C80_1420480 [compost metagenome]
MIELETGAAAKLQPGGHYVAYVLLPARPVLVAIRDEVAGLGVAPGGDELGFHLPRPLGPHRHRDTYVGATLGRRRYLRVVMVDEDPLPPFQSAGRGPLVQAVADGVIAFAIGACDPDIGQGAGIHLDGFHGVAPC